MPGGPMPLGFAYFAGVKLAGYSTYAALLNRQEFLAQSPCSKPSAWKAGIVRTGIGVAVGTAVGVGFWKLVPPEGWAARHGDILFISGLVPVRILEWYFFLRLLYRKCDLSTRSKAFIVALGIVASFLLDAVGVLAMFVLPGGAWIC